MLYICKLISLLFFHIFPADDLNVEKDMNVDFN